MAIAFDPADPYPLLAEGTYTYPETQEHAARVDAWLGIRVEEIEAALAARAASGQAHAEGQRWIGLPAQALLTPYIELRRMLEDLRPRAGQEILDLGAGYGRLGLVLARHFPGARFTGFEIVPERVREGARVLEEQGARDARLIEADLARPEFRLPEADFYFLYDYGTREAIEGTLQALRALARNRPVTVIGRGRATRDLIERAHPWLAGILPPLHRGNYGIYRSG